LDSVNLFQEGLCFNCSGSPVIFRRHSGQYLCINCFKNSIEAIIRKTISIFKLLNLNDKILVAFSGGISSSTLLYNINEIQKRVYHGESIAALTINSGIDRENLQRTKKFCERYSIQHFVISSDKIDNIISKKEGNTKYELIRILLDYMNDLDFNVLCLGLNLTDIAKACLFNILQESEIPLNNNITKIKIIYPLMRIPEEEIRIYSKLHNFAVQISPDTTTGIEHIVDHFIADCSKKSPEIEFNLFNVYLELSRIGFFNQIMPKLL
jgi:cytoplasmic tRNA 2-thiolation protein 1